MNDATEAAAQESRGRRWLLFIHQLPPKPDYLRVKTRRRLRRIGAVAIKQTVYALPASDEAFEDLQWLRQEIEAEGGERRDRGGGIRRRHLGRGAGRHAGYRTSAKRKRERGRRH